MFKISSRKSMYVFISIFQIYFVAIVAANEDDFESPSEEAVIAGVGPLTSALLGVLFWKLSFWPVHKTLPSAASLWLGYINIILAVFNCIPAFPLDGGRLLRALLWATCFTKEKATVIAAWLGKVFAGNV